MTEQGQRHVKKKSDGSNLTLNKQNDHSFLKGTYRYSCASSSRQFCTLLYFIRMNKFRYELMVFLLPVGAKITFSG